MQLSFRDRLIDGPVVVARGGAADAYSRGNPVRRRVVDRGQVSRRVRRTLPTPKGTQLLRFASSTNDRFLERFINFLIIAY